MVCKGILSHAFSTCCCSPTTPFAMGFFAIPGLTIRQTFSIGFKPGDCAGHGRSAGTLRVISLWSRLLRGYIHFITSVIESNYMKACINRSDWAYHDWYYSDSQNSIRTFINSLLLLWERPVTTVVFILHERSVIAWTQCLGSISAPPKVYADLNPIESFWRLPSVKWQSILILGVWWMLKSRWWNRGIISPSRH